MPHYVLVQTLQVILGYLTPQVIPNPQQALKHLFPSKAASFLSQLIHNGSAADQESLNLLTNTGNSHTRQI